MAKQHTSRQRIARLSNHRGSRWAAPAVAVATALIIAACGSSGGSGGKTASSAGTPSAMGTAVKSTTIGGAAVLTNGNGFTLYTFAPDTTTASKCYGTCAQIWPPV